MKGAPFPLFLPGLGLFWAAFVLANSHSAHCLVLLHECSVQQLIRDHDWTHQRHFLLETAQQNTFQPNSLFFFPLCCVKKLGLASSIAEVALWKSLP